MRVYFHIGDHLLKHVWINIGDSNCNEFTRRLKCLRTQWWIKQHHFCWACIKWSQYGKGNRLQSATTEDKLIRIKLPKGHARLIWKERRRANIENQMRRRIRRVRKNSLRTWKIAVLLAAIEKFTTDMLLIQNNGTLYRATVARVLSQLDAALHINSWLMNISLWIYSLWSTYFDWQAAEHDFFHTVQKRMRLTECLPHELPYYWSSFHGYVTSGINPLRPMSKYGESVGFGDALSRASEKPKKITVSFRPWPLGSGPIIRHGELLGNSFMTSHLDSRQKHFVVKLPPSQKTGLSHGSGKLSRR